MNSIRSQLKSMLGVEPRSGGFRAVFSLRADLSILPDHFSNSLILPGICLVQAVLLSGAICQGVADLRLISLKNAKLLHPILPGEQVVIDANITAIDGGHITIKAKVIGQEKRRAEISLIAGPVQARQAGAA